MNWHFERKDIDPLALGIIALVLILSLIFSSLGIALLYRTFSIRTQIIEGHISPPMPIKERPFPTPQLQFYPPEDLAKFRREEDARLNSYRWVDQKADVVEIPIARAMELLVSENKQPVLGTPGLPQGPTWAEMMRRRAEEGTQQGNKP